MLHYDNLGFLRLAGRAALFFLATVNVATGADEAWIPGHPFLNCFAPGLLRSRFRGKTYSGRCAPEPSTTLWLSASLASHLTGASPPRPAIRTTSTGRPVW